MSFFHVRWRQLALALAAALGAAARVRDAADVVVNRSYGYTADAFVLTQLVHGAPRVGARLPLGPRDAVHQVLLGRREMRQGS